MEGESRLFRKIKDGKNKERLAEVKPDGTVREETPLENKTNDSESTATAFKRTEINIPKNKVNGDSRQMGGTLVSRGMRKAAKTENEFQTKMETTRKNYNSADNSWKSHRDEQARHSIDDDRYKSA